MGMSALFTYNQCQQNSHQETETIVFLSQLCSMLVLFILVQDVTEPPNVTLNGVNLTVVNKFTYLGSVVASTVSHDEEIAGRIGKLPHHSVG